LAGWLLSSRQCPLRTACGARSSALPAARRRRRSGRGSPTGSSPRSASPSASRPPSASCRWRQQFVTLDELAQKQQALPQSYVGLLTDKDNQPTLLVSSTRHGNRVTVKYLRPVEVPAGKVLQVWALPKEGAAFPLGTTATARPPGKTEFEIGASSEKLLSGVARLAVSFEDAPATAQSKPAEFVLSGFCVKLW
jgi:hypothetical protein